MFRQICILVVLVIACKADNPFGNLFSNPSALANVGNLAKSGGLDSLLSGQKSVNDPECQQQSRDCNGTMSMTSIMSKFGGPQMETFTKMLPEDNAVDMCKKKEDPKEEMSFAKIQTLLSGNIQANINAEAKARAKAACQKQFDEEKQKCETMKKAMCSAMSGGNQGCMMALVTDGIAKTSAAKAGGDACQELSKLASGEKVDANALSKGLMTNLGTSAAASNVANGGGSGLASNAGNAAGAAGALGQLGSMPNLFGGGK